jgi:hypothetical protein
MSLSNLPKELLQQLANQNQPQTQPLNFGTPLSKPPSSEVSTSTSSGVSSNPFNSIANLTNAPSFSSLPTILGHLNDTSTLGTSSDALNFLLSSTENVQVQTEASGHQPNLSFEELFQQQQQQIQKQQQLLQVLTTKVTPTSSTTETDSSNKPEPPKLENLPMLTQTLAKWGEYQKPHEEVIGQIIQKRSQEKEDYIDVSPYVTFPQHEAARRLGIPSSTLSKKWKDATVNRKWPYRALAKIDKEIATIMHNIPKNPDGSLDPEVEQQLAVLLRKRQMEARPVIIRLN